MPGEEQTPQAGEQAPDFTLNDMYGKRYQLSELYEQGPVLLVFFRGTWCSSCRTYLKLIEQQHEYYQSVGVQLISVARQRADIVTGYFKLEPITYPYLLDLDLKVITTYGLLDRFALGAMLATVRGRNPGPQAAYPSFFLIEKGGIIRWMYKGKDKYDRPDMAEIRRQVEILTGSVT